MALIDIIDICRWAHIMFMIPGNATNGHSGLLAGLPLGHPLRPDLDPWLAERLDRGKGVDEKCPKGFARE